MADTKPIQRVRNIISHLGISVSAFEKATGMSNNSIQTALKRNSNLKDDTLNSILKAYPDISAEWLLTGNGSMLKKENKDALSLNESPDAYGDSKYLIELQKEYIERLKQEIDGLKK
ncbi:helix-turn-helix transcriptional regulator [Flavobacterium silvaticum]|uniref:Helix-turn-helix transcriptional regulator n=1 Tax=Flavobacterium silvaticum TaxID=1852020 RepID=A0A972FP32_9FLAO|nr:helix-turn-helix transcriptional regulator [Flavobacterium silvaticum]NMH29611.1 helix-turn-helix transcriptional regulator [Flavobacterium silvaticum]